MIYNIHCANDFATQTKQYLDWSREKYTVVEVYIHTLAENLIYCLDCFYVLYRVRNCGLKINIFGVFSDQFSWIFWPALSVWTNCINLLPCKTAILVGRGRYLHLLQSVSPGQESGVSKLRANLIVYLCFFVLFFPNVYLKISEKCVKSVPNLKLFLSTFNYYILLNSLHLQF